MASFVKVAHSFACSTIMARNLWRAVDGKGSYQPPAGAIIGAMIARLCGRLVQSEMDALLVDVGGVAFRVVVPTPVLARAGPPGTEITLRTHLYVRENELALYGVDDEAALRLFELLIGVSGVGPRLAIAILSRLEPGAVYQAILNEDATTLTQVSGVGRKLAQRIILELKAKIESLSDMPGGAAMPTGAFPHDADAAAALVSLGYSPAEARRALAAVELPPEAATEERVVAALRLLARL